MRPPAGVHTYIIPIEILNEQRTSGLIATLLNEVIKVIGG